MANESWVALFTQNATDEAILQEVFPQRSRKLGKPETEGEEERDPQVVGSHRGIFLGLYLGLVNKAPSSFPLEVISYIGSAVNPAVRADIGKVRKTVCGDR